jgi:hypothetical protein
LHWILAGAAGILGAIRTGAAPTGAEFNVSP